MHRPVHNTSLQTGAKLEHHIPCGAIYPDKCLLWQKFA